MGTERKHLELNAAHAEQIIAAKRAEDENLKAQEAAKKAAIKQNKILEDLKKQQMKQAEEPKILLEKLKKQQIKEAEETKKKSTSSILTHLSHACYSKKAKPFISMLQCDEQDAKYSYTISNFI